MIFLFTIGQTSATHNHRQKKKMKKKSVTNNYPYLTLTI